MILVEYAVEFDARLDEATDRTNLQLNDIQQFCLLFMNSGLSTKQIDDIKFQIHGAYRRNTHVRSLALRLAPDKAEDYRMAFY